MQIGKVSTMSFELSILLILILTVFCSKNQLRNLSCNSSTEQNRWFKIRSIFVKVPLNDFLFLAYVNIRQVSYPLQYSKKVASIFRVLIGVLKPLYFVKIYSSSSTSKPVCSLGLKRKFQFDIFELVWCISCFENFKEIVWMENVKLLFIN